jgi:hypothetical protein
MTTNQIYLGPLGRMMAIQIPSGGFSAYLVENGVSHSPLSGRVTKDIFSRRRTFDIALDGLTPRALSWFEMLYTDAISGPFYLIDSSRINRLRARIASSGTAPISHNALDTDWTASSGALTYPAAAVVLLPCGAHFSPGPSTAVQWVPTAAGTLIDTGIVPVLPGEQVTFSVYAQAGTPSLEIVPLNAALVAGAPITGTSVVAGTPPRRYVTYTVPTNGSVVAVQVQLRATAAGTYTTLAWQLEVGSSPGDWVLGTGVPRVLFDDETADRQAVGTYTGSEIILKEV